MVASLIAVAAALSVPNEPASAALPVKDCAAHIAPTTYNVTARGVSCRFARRFARRYAGCYAGRCRHRGFKCRVRRDGVESRDYRCVRGRKVVRWQAGS